MNIRFKPIILIVVLSLMIVGYATYTMVLDVNGTTLISFNENEFDVRVSKLIVNGVDASNNIASDGKSFTFETNFDNEIFTNDVMYLINNNSYQYDADVSISCTPNIQNVPITLQEELINVSAQGSKTNIINLQFNPREEETYLFPYTGGEQTFTAPYSGNYKLEVWGARGGISLANGSQKTIYGKGGYSTGTTTLSENQNLYINVGGAGGTGSLSGCSTGGYNGGGTGTNDGGGCGRSSDDEASGGGGGATHIATATGLLSNLVDNKESILIVAGGGGGASYTMYGGAGGGLNGITTSGTTSSYPTQTTGYSFGKGQNGSGAAGSDGVAGGGGGYYGGYGENISGRSAGTGGSGYIGSLMEAETIAGNAVMPNFAGTGTMTGNADNGYAKITYLGSGSESNQVYVCTINVDSIERNNLANERNSSYSNMEFKYNYTGDKQSFIAPFTGRYKIETWGAQGGDADYDANNFYEGGYGGYSVGEVDLSLGDRLYLYVGGKGFNDEESLGGYNGGGKAYQNHDSGSIGGGGGATHVAKVSGLLSELKDHQNEIIIVSGGGGGSNYWRGGQWGYGGSGGGASGADGHRSHGHTIGTGGTQESGGTGGGSGSFGQGASSYVYEGSSGGGGGFYGGGSSIDNAGGGGGSGYIGYIGLLNKAMYCYNCPESSDENTYTVLTIGESTHEDDRDLISCPDGYSSSPISKCAKSGNGYAKITYLG